MNHPSPSAVCLSRFSAAPIRYLGGRANQHWLVETPRGQLVLSGFSTPLTSVSYERELLRHLRERGWPVPEPIDEPFEGDGHVWSLSTFLPGTINAENNAAAQRARGHLLADLHESTAGLTSMGQRPGFERDDRLASDHGLLEALQRYERLHPVPGHILRWHFDKMGELYSEIDVDHTDTIILHGDFAPWNILYERGALSGIYDFELAHLNFRVSDFALSWRGYQDDVIAGYMERYSLSERDQKMIVPTFWSWLFKGVKDEIVHWEHHVSTPPNFEWQIKKLLVRSARYPAERYPKAHL